MSPKEKASSFLASLKAGNSGGGGGGLFGGGAAASSPAPAASPDLLNRIAELEKKLADVAKAALPPEEGEPPKPPTELMLFLQQRVSVLEEKLAAAHEEAVRANLMLREREEAQRRAQKEVEELFRSIREHTRAGQWDARLREELKSSQDRLHELERRLSGMVPADEILLLWNDVEGRAQLEKRLKEKAEALLAVKKAEAAQQKDPAAPPAPPSEYTDAKTVAILMGRLADLEGRLQAAETERDQEKARRLMWEKQIMEDVVKDAKAFERSGDSKLVVEAALENAAAAVRERDALAAEMGALLKRIQSEPYDSSELPSLRAQLSMAQARMQQLQESLAKHAALVQVWLRDKKS